MRVANFIIVALSALALSACVPGTVEYDDPNDGQPPEDSPQSNAPSDETDDENGTPDSADDEEEDAPQTPIGDDTTDEMEPDPEPMCPSGQDMCASMCVDLTSDSAHCGACDNACPAGSSCGASSCTCDSANEEICDDSCVDTTTSTQHCGGCNMPCSGGMICSSGQCVENTEIAGVLQQTNAARAAGANCGVYGAKDPAPPVVGDPELHEAAQVHAEDMAANDFFDHTGSDGSSFSDRIRRTDYAGSPMSENIAAGYGSPASVVAGWVDSDGHCRNLMNAGSTKIGIGYATGGSFGTYWVQVFGR